MTDAQKLVTSASESLDLAHRWLGRMSVATSTPEFAEAADALLAAARDASRTLALLVDLDGDERQRAFASWFDDHMPPLLRRAEDFFFKGADKRPAIALSEEYLEHVATMLAMTKRALKHFGLMS